MNEIIQSLIEIQKKHEWVIGQIYLMVQAREAGDNHKFEKFYSRLKQFGIENWPPNNVLRADGETSIDNQGQ